MTLPLRQVYKICLIFFHRDEYVVFFFVFFFAEFEGVLNCMRHCYETILVHYHKNMI